MTIGDMMLELEEQLKKLPSDIQIKMHLGDTLCSADASIKVVGTTFCCSLWREFTKEDERVVRCARCDIGQKRFESELGTCSIGEDKIGDKMTRVLQIAGDW